MPTTVNDFNKTQINHTVRKNSRGEVVDRSTMINIRVDDPDECFRLYQHLCQKLNGELHIAIAEEQKDEAAKECPNCGGSLVERTVKNGAKAGKVFLGCKNFPNCRYTA